MIFIRTLGVDEGEAGIVLTASTGRRVRGLQQEAEPPQVLSGEDSSISGAVIQVAQRCDQQVFYGYADQLLLGEDWCERGIQSTLEYFARDVELGLGTEVWAVVGTAQATIESGGEEGIDSRLSTLQLEHIQGSAAMTRTVGQVLTDILEDGASYLPRLAASEEGVLSAGYTIIKGDVAVLALAGESAYGLELLEGDPSGDVFVSDGGVVLDIWGADCEVQPVFQGGDLVGAEILCAVTADLAEYHQLPDGEEMELLRTQLSQREERCILSTITQLQRVNADAIGLGRQLGMDSPSHWEALEEGWQEIFPELPITVTVEVTIRRS